MAKRRAEAALQADLESVLTARLCLILLPVRRHLQEQGYVDLADAVGVGVAGIRPAITKILSYYQVAEIRR